METRRDVVSIEAAVQTRPGVKFFSGNRYPVRYFLLISDDAISEVQFKSWLPASRFSIAVYGDGENAKAACLKLSQKNTKAIN